VLFDVLQEMNVTPKAFRLAFYPTLVLSLAGLALVCWLIIGMQNTAKSAISWLPQIAVGYAAMILIVEVVGIRLRSHLTRFGVGTLFAFFLFIAGVLGGSATSMVVYQSYDPGSYNFNTPYWMGIYCFIQALVIGLIGTLVLRATSRKTGEQVSGGNSGQRC
jgi:FtsH-binding integral membrane protein